MVFSVMVVVRVGEYSVRGHGRVIRSERQSSRQVVVVDDVKFICLICYFGTSFFLCLGREPGGFFSIEISF